jgi:diketogulonate reductase-like aldo/keto reductase
MPICYWIQVKAQRKKSHSPSDPYDSNQGDDPDTVDLTEPWKRIQMNELTIDTRTKLNNGIEMPLLGFGTYQIGSGQKAQNAVLHALEAGYRLIDTASMYGNEREVGEALRISGIPRQEVFITTKLWNSDHGYEAAIAAFERSLKELGLSYLDLYLIHWPVQDLRIETWKALETILTSGRCRAIGVSNYLIRHLEELLDRSDIVPAVNQAEFSPYLYQRDLVEFCHAHHIQLEAYSPLTKGRQLGDPELSEIAARYFKSPAQILIRWALQKGLVVIPKSSNKNRISENAQVFDFAISVEDMNALDSFHRELHTSWDPSSVP